MTGCLSHTRRWMKQATWKKILQRKSENIHTTQPTTSTSLKEKRQNTS